jgi:hypothetical protein
VGEVEGGEGEADCASTDEGYADIGVGCHGLLFLDRSVFDPSVSSCVDEVILPEAGDYL